MVRLRHFHGLPTILGRLHRHARVVEHFEGHLTIDRVVFGQQDAGARSVFAQQRFGVPDFHALRYRRRFLQATLKPGRKPEGTAHVHRAVHADVAPHQPCQAPADGKAQPTAAKPARGRHIRLFEGVEQPPYHLCCDSDAGVLHLETNQQFVAAFLHHPGAHTDRAAFGEFHGIARIVEQCLAQPRGVALQPQRHVSAINLDLQSFAARRLADHCGNIVKNGRKAEIATLQLQPVGFYLGQVEDVVDDRKKMAAGAVDLVQAIGLQRRHASAPQQMAQADDRIHRRAYLVAHVGEERALGLVRGFGLLACHAQLDSALFDLFFQQRPVLVQFITKAFFLGDILLHRHVVGHRPIRLTQGCDDGELVIFAAVLAAVVKQTFPWHSLRQRRPHLRIGLGRRLA